MDTFESQGSNSTENEKDLLIARKIHAAMMPQRLPSVEGVEIFSLFLPGNALGGDLFDVISLSEDMLALYLIDLAGHGVSAALISSMIKVYAGEYIRCFTSPRLVMERVNAQLIHHVAADFHLTAFIAYLDLHDNKLTYCNAGQTFPIVYRGMQRSIESLNSSGIFMGGAEQVFYTEKSLYLYPGDWLFFFTDGLYRIFNPNNEQMGRTIFEKEIITFSRDRSIGSFIHSLECAAQGAPPDHLEDDVVAIAIEFLTQSRKNRIKEKLGFHENDPVYLQFISYFEEMDKAAAVILSAMDSLGFPDESIRKMKIILTELFANAIYHGNDGDHSKKVTVGHIIDKNMVKISIMDEGKGFAPSQIPDPTLPENLVKDCGRGLFIVRSYVDGMEFNTLGNRVTVLKYNGVR